MNLNEGIMSGHRYTAYYENPEKAWTYEYLFSSDNEEEVRIFVHNYGILHPKTEEYLFIEDSEEVYNYN